MKLFRDLTTIILVLLLGVCIFAYYSTRESATPAAPQKSSAPGQPLVDTSLLQNAVGLAPLAAVPDEQVQAREAWRLADHELDLTFAAAMREAEAEAALPTAGPLRQLGDRITQLKSRVEADKRRVELLGKDAGEELDRAQAQLDLDQDELDDAQQELAREGGDKRATLQRLLQEHEASDKVADQAIRFGAPGDTSTLSERLREWLSLRDYRRRLHAAAQDAAAHARMLVDQHNTLERQLPSNPDLSASVTRLRQLAAQRKTLAGLDQRAQDTNQLVTVYQRWGTFVERRQRAALHLLLRSSVAIIAVLLVMVLLNRIFHRSFLAFRQTDRRRLQQLRMIARISLQVAAVLVILLIIFGPPTQLSTAIGLVTAGLAVVMKDFILAFLGWFALMGKNGVSVGDWVEIEGVSGEVVEIGLFKTVLLELGNWTESGHPTGRRVAFSNGFAIESHYFNFSTTGQWLWDDIEFALPPEADPYETAKKVREIAERETRGDAAQAARDWQHVTDQYGTRKVSAMPVVDLRPRDNGLEVVVRYITRASERNTVKLKLFQAIMDLLSKHA